MVGRPSAPPTYPGTPSSAPPCKTPFGSSASPDHALGSWQSPPAPAPPVSAPAPPVSAPVPPKPPEPAPPSSLPALPAVSVVPAVPPAPASPPAVQLPSLQRSPGSQALPHAPQCLTSSSLSTQRSPHW